MIGDSSASKEEIQFKYDRLVSCSFLVLGFMVDSLSAEESAQLQQQLSQLLGEKKFWGFAKSENPIVRRALYRVVSQLCQKLPSVLEPQLKVATGSVLSLGDTDTLTHSELWDAALLLSKSNHS